MWLLVITFLIFLIIALVLYALKLYGQNHADKKAVDERLQQYMRLQPLNGMARLQHYGVILWKFLSQSAERLRLPQPASLEQKLQQGGIPVTVKEFLLLLVVIMVSGGLLIGFLFWSIGWGIVGMVLVAPTGLGIVQYFVYQRQQKLGIQLGSILLMMANALRSGFSLLQAVELVATDMEPPISHEFRQMLQEVRLGIPLEAAFPHMGKRINNPDFDLVITSILIQRQVGGNLAQIFDIISDTIQERIRLRQEVNALTAQGRFSAWVLGALPVAVAFIMHMMAPTMMAPLFTTTIGRVAIVIGLIMDAIGIFCILKIATIKV